MAKRTQHALDRLAEAAQSIREQEAIDAGTVGFYPRVMCQIALPASRFTDNEYERVSGGYHLTVQSPRVLGVPWGIYPRGILAWMASEVTKRKNQGEDTRKLHLGDSLAEFIQNVSGTHAMSGGTSGNILRFKAQMASLLASRIFYWYEKSSGKDGLSEGATAMQFRSLEIASEGNLLWHPQTAGLFQSHITLGEAFHQDLLDHAVPVDERALQALWPACLPTDIYVWATYRAAAMQRQRRPSITITWEQIKLQFGPDYTTMRSFKQHFLLALKKVQVVYRELEYAEADNGMVFKMKRPSISTSTSYKLQA